MEFEQGLGHVSLYLRDYITASRWETNTKAVVPTTACYHIRKQNMFQATSLKAGYFPYSYHKIKVTRGSEKKG